MTDILMISHLVPNDNGSGVQRRAAVHLKALTERFNVHLLVFEAQPVEHTEAQRALLARCASAIVIPAPERARRSLINVPPFAIIAELLEPTTARMVPADDLLQRAVARLPVQEFAATFCFRIRSGLVFRRLRQVAPLEPGRCIVDFDDIESVVALRSESYAPKSRGFEQTVIDRLKIGKIRRVEKDFLAEFDDVLVCSEADRRALTDTGPRARIHAIPNSVPIPSLVQSAGSRERANILFVGTMTYGPNQDAATWFCRAILPRIREGAGMPVDATLVGFNPPPSIRQLAEMPGVVVTGGVDRVEPYYEACDLVVAPIRYGGGTRIKILEAMSHARPVVSTTIGAEGLDVTPNANILMADDEESFAAACLTLLRDPARAAMLGLAGRRFVEERYSAPVIASALARVVAGPTSM